MNTLRRFGLLIVIFVSSVTSQPGNSDTRAGENDLLNRLIELYQHSSSTKSQQPQLPTGNHEFRSGEGGPTYPNSNGGKSNSGSPFSAAMGAGKGSPFSSAAGGSDSSGSGHTGNMAGPFASAMGSDNGGGAGHGAGPFNSNMGCT